MQDTKKPETKDVSYLNKCKEFMYFIMQGFAYCCVALYKGISYFCVALYKGISYFCVALYKGISYCCSSVYTAFCGINRQSSPDVDQDPGPRDSSPNSGTLLAPGHQPNRKQTQLNRPIFSKTRKTNSPVCQDDEDLGKLHENMQTISKLWREILVFMQSDMGQNSYVIPSGERYPELTDNNMEDPKGKLFSGRQQGKIVSFYNGNPELPSLLVELNNDLRDSLIVFKELESQYIILRDSILFKEQESQCIILLESDEFGKIYDLLELSNTHIKKVQGLHTQILDFLEKASPSNEQVIAFGLSGPRK